MNFKKDIGVNLYVGGFVLVGKGKPTLVMFPNVELFEDGRTPEVLMGQFETDESFEVFQPTLQEFEQIVRQMDLQEVEITNSAGEKMIVRMTQRQLDSNISWKVFERDGYKCRYCGATGVVLTYDHVLRWEEGGDNTMDNGVTACRKCNKQRGDTDYAEWLKSDLYKTKSINVEERYKAMNEALVPLYQGFRKRDSNRKR